MSLKYLIKQLAKFIIHFTLVTQKYSFSGRRSPEIRESFESARFSSVENEDLTQRGLFVAPCFEAEIASSLNNSFIKFSPGIPEDLVDTSDTTYFIRSYGLSGNDQLQDIEIRFFENQMRMVL